MLTRRRFLVWGAGSVATVGFGACSSRSASKSNEAPGTTTDDSARFAAFEPAAEPNGDPAKVVWPDSVTAAGPDVQALYEFESDAVLDRFADEFNRLVKRVDPRMDTDKVLDAMDEWVLAHEDGTLAEVWR